MSNRPSSWRQARSQVDVFMRYRLSHCSRKRKKQIIREYGNIFEAIWKRWQVGIYSAQSKHIRWYLEVATAGLAPGTRYRHWRRCRELMVAMGVYDDWSSHVRGSWCTPLGLAQQSLREHLGRKPKYCRLSDNESVKGTHGGTQIKKRQKKA
jgi:hypothetical protein